MTREDIIRMAQECNLIGMRPHLDGIYQESIERFAALVVAAEREAAEERVTDLFADMETPYLPDIVAAIRAREQT